MNAKQSRIKAPEARVPLECTRIRLEPPEWDSDFLVPVAGSIKLMPGTGSDPAFRRIDFDTNTGKAKACVLPAAVTNSTSSPSGS